MVALGIKGETVFVLNQVTYDEYKRISGFTDEDMKKQGIVVSKYMSPNEIFVSEKVYKASE